MVYTYFIGKDNPYKVEPTYNFWAPWIGKRSRGPVAYNTERRKHPKFFQENMEQADIDGDRLQELMCNASVSLFNIIIKLLIDDMNCIYPNVNTPYQCQCSKPKNKSSFFNTSIYIWSLVPIEILNLVWKSLYCMYLLLCRKDVLRI